MQRLEVVEVTDKEVQDLKDEWALEHEGEQPEDATLNRIIEEYAKEKARTDRTRTVWVTDDDDRWGLS